MQRAVRREDETAKNEEETKEEVKININNKKRGGNSLGSTSAFLSLAAGQGQGDRPNKATVSDR